MCAQFARPGLDVTVDNWTENDNSATNLSGRIDEVAANDGDYIRSQLTPTNDVFVCKLGTLGDPVSSTGHMIRYRYGKDVTGGGTMGLTVQLRQGYVSEGSQGTLIKQWVHSAISSTLTTATQTLSGAEADSITDYTSLFLRFSANQT